MKSPAVVDLCEPKVLSVLCCFVNSSGRKAVRMQLLCYEWPEVIHGLNSHATASLQRPLSTHSTRWPKQLLGNCWNQHWLHHWGFQIHFHTSFLMPSKIDFSSWKSNFAFLLSQFTRLPLIFSWKILLGWYDLVLNKNFYTSKERELRPGKQPNFEQAIFQSFAL